MGKNPYTYQGPPVPSWSANQLLPITPDSDNDISVQYPQLGTPRSLEITAPCSIEFLVAGEDNDNNVIGRTFTAPCFYPVQVRRVLTCSPAGSVWGCW